jgi:HEAT repeat protein
MPGRLGRVIGLQRGEGRLVGPAVAISFLASGGLMMGGSGIEALFFARYGVSKLPTMYLILGVLMFLATLGFAVLVGRVGRGLACVVIPLALAILAVAGRVVLAGGADWITPALWLLQGAAQFLVGLSVWGLAGLVTDTRQAKRFFPLIGAGGVLGYVLGGLLTLPVAARIGTSNLLLVWAATLVGVVLIGVRLVTMQGREVRPAHRAGDGGAIDQLTRGLRYVQRSPLMRWMALGAILFSLLFFSLYLPFSRAATARYPNPDDLAGFFGVFFGVSTGVALLVSLFVTNRLLSRFGVPIVLLILPVLYVAAFGVLIVTATFSVLATFRFLQVSWLSGGAGSSTEAVINTVPADRRDQTRAFLYGGPTQIGTILAGVVALVGQKLSPTTLYVVGLVSAVLATIATLAVRREYPRELARALREGRPHLFGTDPSAPDPFGLASEDRSAIEAAVQGLADPDPRVRRVAVAVLGDLRSEEGAAPLLSALSDDDADIRAGAIRSLAAIGAPEAYGAILEGLADPDESVRVAAMDATAVMPLDAASTARLRPLLHDPDPRVAARAAAALLAAGDDPEASAVLAALAADPRPGARAEAVTALGRVHTGPPAALIEALGDASPAVRDAAARALGGWGPDAAPPLIEALGSADRREAALDALEGVPLDGEADELRRFAHEMVGESAEDRRSAASISDDTGERVALLRDSLRWRSDRRASYALRADAIVVGSPMMSVALENIFAARHEQRANALEVIEQVGTPDVVKPLIAMWDGTPRTVDQPDLLDRLRRDPDPWIRACAELAAGETPPPTTEGGDMTRTLTTLSPMERVLFLRNVGLFAALAPSDLLPIAGVAQEHAYVDGDVIAEQGEIGDVLHIIVEGTVAVLVRTDGEPREVATRSVGDVVGEMSVITSEPRVATLAARGDVRVLSIDRPAFESILRERPETALGVIRILSQRLAELSVPEAGAAGHR